MPPDPSNTHVPNTSPDLFDPALSSDSPIWPKPIGILSIVFGSLGLICNGCGGVSLLAQPFLMSFGEEQFGPAPDVFKPLLGQVVLLPIALILSIVLLFAGIMLLGRKPASRTLHLLYAWLSVPLAFAGTYFGYKQITRLVEWKSANPSNGWATARSTQTSSSPSSWSASSSASHGPSSSSSGSGSSSAKRPTWARPAKSSERRGGTGGLRRLPPPVRYILDPSPRA